MGYTQSSDRMKEDFFRSYMNGTMFTTRDPDNDGSLGNCVSDLYRGGWWYFSCGYFSPNGNYEGDVTPTKTGIHVRFIDTEISSYADTKAVKSVVIIIRTRGE